MSLAQVKKKQGSYFFCITFFIGFAAMKKKPFLNTLSSDQQIHLNISISKGSW